MGGWRSLLIGAGLLAAIPASRAAEPALRAKPGLWQVTVTATVSGARFAHPSTKTTVIKQCHTWRKFAFEEADRASCEKPVVSRTATTVEMHLECKGEPHSMITSHLQILAPEKFAATQEMSWGGVQQNTRYQGKWLGRNCNGLRPLD